MHVDSKFTISLLPKDTFLGDLAPECLWFLRTLSYYASHGTINTACLRVAARPYGKPELSPLGAGLLSER
jgi:hypothetical protein